MAGRVPTIRIFNLPTIKKSMPGPNPGMTRISDARSNESEWPDIESGHRIFDQ
jgi:hypothetical protein